MVDGESLWPDYSWANVKSKYAIVFLANDQSTVIDLGVLGLLIETDTIGVDLNEREWEVVKSPWC